MDKRKLRWIIVAVALAVLLTFLAGGCDGTSGGGGGSGDVVGEEDDGDGGDNGDEEPPEPTEVTYDITLRVVANDNPIPDADLTIDGDVEGTSNAQGIIQFEYTTTEPVEPFTVTLSKKFFVTATRDVTAEQLESLDYTSRTTVDIGDVELPPQIFIPDTGNARIVRIDDMEGTSREEIDQITTDGDTYDIRGPLWVEVDYDSGIIYIADADPFDFPGTSPCSEYDPASLIKLETFPPDPETSVVVSPLPGEQQICIPTQIALNPDGGILVAEQGAYDLTVRNLVSFDDVSESDSGTRHDLGEYHLFPQLTGVAVLPDDSILVLHGNQYGVDLRVFDDLYDTEPEDFTGGGIMDGTGEDQFLHPARVIVDPSGDYVYISDSGDPNYPDSPSDSNNRVARFDIDGTNRVNWGSTGDGDEQFCNPVLLGMLPDRRLYVMDVSNGRLVRVNSFDDADTTWEEYDPSGDDAFNFQYAHNYS